MRIRYLVVLCAVCMFFPVKGFAGGKIAYSCLTNGFWQIWVHDVTSGKDEQVTESPFDKRSPAWSPDGKQLIYRTGNGELFKLDLETKTNEQVLSSIQYCVDPQWVSENELLVTRYRTDVQDDSDIWLVDIASGSREVLVSEPGLQFQPRMSSDGKKIVYVSSVEPECDNLYEKEIQSKKSVKLTHDKGFCSMPVFSPDGNRIAFVSNRTGDYEIYLMDLKDKSMTQLTKRAGIDNSPQWISPSEIIFASYTDGKFQINTLKFENMMIKPLISKETDCTDPDWTDK